MTADKMKYYCNNCGKRCFTRPSQALGRNYKCCSVDCLHAIELRDIEANMQRARPEWDQ